VNRVTLVLALALMGIGAYAQITPPRGEKRTAEEIEAIRKMLAENLRNPTWYDPALTAAAREAQEGRQAAPTAVWAIESGVLPPGVALAIDGRLTGTPMQSGTYRFRLRATVPGQGNVYHDFELVVDPNTVIDPTPPPRGRVAQAYAFQFKAVEQAQLSTDNDQPL
jgi:hypothetical protein